MIKRGRKKLANACANIVILVDNLERVYPGDFNILKTIRGQEEQDRLFRENATHVQYPHSKHYSNPSKAIDMAPVEVDGKLNWKNLELFAHFSGYVLAVAKMKNIKVRWGRDWDRDGDLDDQTFNDYPHFEIV